MQLGEQQIETIQARTSETSILQLHFRNTYIFLLGMPPLQQYISSWHATTTTILPTQYENSCHLPSVIGSPIG
jgi:hypothetical protein